LNGKTLNELLDDFLEFIETIEELIERRGLSNFDVRTLHRGETMALGLTNLDSDLIVDEFEIATCGVL